MHMEEDDQGVGKFNEEGSEANSQVFEDMGHNCSLHHHCLHTLSRPIDRCIYCL